MSDEDDILAANAAYYHAFATCDFDAMSRLWADDGISCVHPGWPVLIGRYAVIESYGEILRNPNQQRIEHRNDMALFAGDDGRVLCVEFVNGMALAATNLFRRIDGAWRMIHHQASPIAGLVESDAPPPSSQRLN
jgi:ketosteroid isomerase-like protein